MWGDVSFGMEWWWNLKIQKQSQEGNESLPAGPLPKMEDQVGEKFQNDRLTFEGKEASGI